MSVTFRDDVFRVVRMLCFCLVLGACLPSQSEQSNADDSEIIKGEIAGQEFYVPKVYFKLKGENFANQNIYLLLMYPNFSPLMEDQKEMWDKGEWYRNIRILAQYYQHPAGIEKLAAINIKNLSAFEMVGDEYGLVHRTQPDGYVKDRWDMWLEEMNGKPITYVTCTEKYSENSVPQCSLHQFIDSFHVETNFDKRLLPDWKNIKNNTLALLQSFESERSAQEFLRTALWKTNLLPKRE